MYKSFAAVCACAAALLGTPSAIAQIEATPIPLPPKPNFSSMQFMLGTWNCTETNTRRATAYTNTIMATLDPSGYWIVRKNVAHPVSFDPTPTVTMEKITYDSGSSRWIDVSTDDRGTYSVTVSPGWRAGNLVWHTISGTGVTSGNVVDLGDTTYTKANDTKMTYTGWFKESGGRKITLKGTCIKG